MSIDAKSNRTVRTGKRSLSIVMSLLMVLSLITVFATETSMADSGKLTLRSALSTYTLKVKTSHTIPVVLYDGQKISKEKVSYKSSNKKVATVTAAGKVTAKKTGKATITVSAKNASSLKITVNVVKKTKKLKSHSMVNAPSSIQVSTSVKLTHKVSPSNATNLKVTYKSSNAKVLAVDKAGTIKGVSPGTATLSVKIGSKSVTKSVKVTSASAPIPAPTPAPVPAVSVVAVKVPNLNYTTNYILLSQPNGDFGYSYLWNNAAVTPTPVLADKTLVKIPMTAGSASGSLIISHSGVPILEKTITASSAGLAAPQQFYGTVPMSFSAFFHDVTADKDLSLSTVFATDGTVDTPEKFITEGSRTATVIGGVTTTPYAEAEAAGLPAVDAVSTATYGDSVHFPPNGNLALTGGSRLEKTNPNAAIAGVKQAEISVRFDLYANASILKQTGRATAQSANVLSKLTKNKFNLLNVALSASSILDASGNAAIAPQVYKAKAMLIDGNFGARVLVNAAAATDLPGDGNGGTAEAVAYGGNWGDIVTGFSFGDATALTPEYAGANYWDNFANNIYGGVITDSAGHSEPLVFLQNLFSHRMHTDFDVALSPSRFSRLKSLNYPDTYSVTVFVDGFKDVEFSFDAKKFVNDSAATAVPSYAVSSTIATTDVVIQGITNPAKYMSDARLYLGTNTANPVTYPSGYSLGSQGKDRVKLTLNPAALTGTWWGTYSVQMPATATEAYKTVSFTVTNGAPITFSSNTSGGTVIGSTSTTTNVAIATTVGAAQTNPIVISSETELYIAQSAFASALSTTGTTATTIRESTDPATAAVAIGTAGDGNALVRTSGPTSPYKINLGSTAFQSTKTYVIVFKATNCSDKTVCIQIP